MKKRILATVLAAVSTISLAGCGGVGNNNVGENGEVNVMLLKCGLGEDFVKNLTDDFYNETGITVNVFSDKLLDEDLSSSMPNNEAQDDIYMSGNTYDWLNWVVSDTIEELTDLCNEPYADGSTINGKIAEPIRDLGKIGDHRYIIQVSYCPTGIVYNQDMLNDLYEKKIADSNVFPTTWEGLVKLAKAVSEADYKWNGTDKTYGIIWGNQETDLMDTFKTLWAQSDYDKYVSYFEQEELSEDLFASSERAKALEAIYDLLAPKDGVSSTSVPQMLRTTHTDGYSYFLKGNALMCFAGSWFESEMRANITDKTFNYRFAPVPALEGNEITVNINYPTEYMFIPSNSKNKENAKKFLKYMFEEDNLKKMHETLQTPLAFDYDTRDLKLTDWGKDIEAAMKYKQTVSGAVNLYYLAGRLRPEVSSSIFEKMYTGSIEKTAMQSWLVSELTAQANDWQRSVQMVENYRNAFREKGLLK